MRRVRLGFWVLFGLIAPATAIVSSGCTSAEPHTGVAASGDAGGVPRLSPATYCEVAPLLARHCGSCHVQGGVGPFRLTTFEEARAHHAAIASAVGTREMPPWLPGDGCQTFKDARRLTDIEIEAFRSWSAAGAPRGPDPAPAPAAAPKELAWVDAVVDIGVDYVAQAAQGPADDWRCFLIDPKLTEERVLVGYDLEPTDRQSVHHAAIVEAPIDTARAKDEAEPGGGWPCAGGVNVPSGAIVGSWAAGYGAVEYPRGTGMPLPKGRGLVVQVHYHQHDLDRPPTPDRTRISLQYARESVAKATYMGIGVNEINLPPRTRGTTLAATSTIGTDTMLHGLVGHMHLLGTKLRVELLDTGAPTCLLDIPRWNYRWEELVFLDGPVRLPAGSTVKLSCTWDNPSDGLVVSGLTAADEMCDVGLIVTQ